MELNISYSSDKYQYTMAKSYFENGMKDKIAVFNMFYRQAPDNNNWAVVSGIEEVIEMIGGLGTMPPKFFKKFLPGEENQDIIKYLSNLKFTGKLYAMREGEIAFPGEPIIIIEAPLIEAQILETPLLSIMNHQMAVATKASRVTRSTKKPVSEFGSRRAHGPWAAIYGGKAAFIGGCINSSNIVTSDIFGITAAGTMAHSYITSFGCSIKGEKRAFDLYLKSHFGSPLVLLIDTYDSLKCGLKNAISSFKENGIDDSYQNSYGIRLDSGDLAYLSAICRKELDKAGLKKCKIFATNSLDEYIISELEKQNAAIDIYGVGDAIATSKHNPCFGNVYKLVQIDGEPVLKRSEDKSKAINPGFQITYRITKENSFKADVTCVRGDKLENLIKLGKSFTIRSEYDKNKSTTFNEGEYSVQSLQEVVMLSGKRVNQKREISVARDYYLSRLEHFNCTEIRIINPHYYKVDISDDLYDLKSSLINSLIKEINDYE